MRDHLDITGAAIYFIAKSKIYEFYMHYVLLLEMDMGVSS